MSTAPMLPCSPNAAHFNYPMICLLFLSVPATCTLTCQTCMPPSFESAKVPVLSHRCQPACQRGANERRGGGGTAEAQPAGPNQPLPGYPAAHDTARQGQASCSVCNCNSLG